MRVIPVGCCLKCIPVQVYTAMINVLAAIHNVDVFKDTTVHSLNIYSILNLKGMFKYFAFEIVFLENYISKKF